MKNIEELRESSLYSHSSSHSNLCNVRLSKHPSTTKPSSCFLSGRPPFFLFAENRSNHSMIITTDNTFKKLMLPFLIFPSTESWRRMRKTGGRETSHSQHRGSLSPEAFGRFSSSSPDKTDSEILSLTGDRPMTILKVAEKIDISFVECLARMRKLWRLNLLERIDVEPEEVGLYRYTATVKEE